jgi:hypothetical protein
MSGLVFSNFAETTLAGSLNTVATSIPLASGGGALFPPLSTAGQYFIGVLIDALTRTKFEIVKVTARTGDTVTVTRAQEGTSAQTWSAGDLFKNLVTAGGLATFNQFNILTWDLSAPPSTDQVLQPGDGARITFESVTQIPLTIQTVPGFYQILMAVTANNSTNADLFFLPNNTTYANAFSRYSIEAADSEITGFGSATSDPTTTSITGTVPGFSALIPQNAVQYLTLPSFFIDLFLGPVGADNLNDRGPFIVDMLISTTTAAKYIKSTGAIIGGAHVASSLWSDTVTAWTSLGTLQVWSGTGTSNPPNLNKATISGFVAVNRIA